jgi:ribosomal protein S18 acetylase RimI-like enzyme
MTLLVRAATADDLAAVSVLAAKLVRLHHDWDADRFFVAGAGIEAGYKRFLTSELKRAESCVLVACTDRVVGYAFGRVEPRNWESLLDECGVLHDIYVDDSARMQGAATALLQAFIQHMRARAMQKVVLFTASQNVGGQALFRKHGFRPTMLEMTLTL